jgi:hypothetical protein
MRQIEVGFGRWSSMKCASCGRALRSGDVAAIGSHRLAVCSRCATSHFEWFREYDPASYRECEAGCGLLIATAWWKRRERCCSDRCRENLAKVRRRVSRTERECEVCGTRFTPTRKDGIYCTNACRQRAYRDRLTTVPRKERGERRSFS